MFSFNTITCCYLTSFACYHLLTLESLVVIGPSENQSKEMYSYQIMTIGKSRGRFCHRLDHQKINPKKCTLIKFWKYGKPEADFVVSWTIRESIQKMNSYQILTIGKSRGRFCRRLDQSKEIYSYQILTIRKSRGRFCRRLDHQNFFSTYIYDSKISFEYA